MISSSPRILIVDDTATNRMILRRILEQQDFLVDECASGEECLAYCENERPAMVLLDVMMPGLDGFGTCEKLRAAYSSAELPVILVTARSEGADVKRGIESGANDYITKPVDKSIFLARVSNQLTVARSYKKIKAQQAFITRSLWMQRSIGNSLDEAIFVTNEDDDILYRNNRCVFCCNEQRPPNLEAMTTVLFSGGVARLLRDMQELIALDPVISMEQEVRVPAPASLSLEFKTYPIGERTANSKLRLWTFRDVTIMRELEKRISQQVKMNTVTQFAVGVAHNFNNLLGSILGAAEVLKKGSHGDQTAERCLNVIERAVENGMDLTEKMSTLVKQDFAPAKDELQDLQAVIHDVVERYSNRDGCATQFNLSIEPELPRLAVDRTNLVDIVTNIVSNAVDAVAVTEAPGAVWIAAQHKEQAAVVELRVWDNGCGITPKVQQRLYEPFFSTKNLDTRNGMSMVGNGLGMWNVYNLIRSLDGDIKVESSPNKGTEVRICFPVPADLQPATQNESGTPD